MLFHFLSGTEKGSKARILQFVSAVSDSGLGSYIQKLSEGEKVALGQRYLTDHVLLSFKVRSEEELWVRYKCFVFMATNLFSHDARFNVCVFGCMYFLFFLQVFRTAVLGCVIALQMEMSVTPDLSPSWILAAAQIYAPRMDTLSHTLQLNPQLVHIIQRERESPEMVRSRSVAWIFMLI